MIVRDLMLEDVQTCSPADSLRDVALTFQQEDYGSLPVVDPHTTLLVGMITDRDICLKAAQTDLPLSQLTVEEAMSRGVVWSCKPTDDLPDVEETLRLHHVRRLPVVDHIGHLVGLLSVGQLLRTAARGTPELTPEETVSTLAAVSERRRI